MPSPMTVALPCCLLFFELRYNIPKWWLWANAFVLKDHQAFFTGTVPATCVPPHDVNGNICNLEPQRRTRSGSRKAASGTPGPTHQSKRISYLHLANCPLSDRSKIFSSTSRMGLLYRVFRKNCPRSKCRVSDRREHEQREVP